MSWALVIFASRETVTTLRQTIDAALVSAGDLASIEVLVNGNPQLASDVAHHRQQTVSPIEPSAGSACAGPRIRIWSIPLGDKANAWNQYIHQIWSGEDLAFFVDGYVRLNADAVQLLGDGVTADDRALGGCGVPTVGRSAQALRNNLILNTGFHGNFCCIKGRVLAQMRDAGISLPIGLYRTDSLMGALLCYSLNPATHVWEDDRILVHPQASWQIDLARWWYPMDVIKFFKRVIRQTRGKLENAALANHLSIRRLPPQNLDATARELVLQWANRCPEELGALQKWHLGVRLAVRAYKKSSVFDMRSARILPVRAD